MLVSKAAQETAARRTREANTIISMIELSAPAEKNDRSPLGCMALKLGAKSDKTPKTPTQEQRHR